MTDADSGREPNRDSDVTGMGKGFMDHSIIAVLFGAAAAFGGGSLGAQVPPKSPAPKPMSRRMQWVSGLLLYGPLLTPIVLWFFTRNWLPVLIWTAIVWSALFFSVGFVVVVVGYRRAKAGHVD